MLTMPPGGHNVLLSGGRLEAFVLNFKTESVPAFSKLPLRSVSAKDGKRGASSLLKRRRKVGNQ
jgi:hypothetical protein